MEIQQREGKNHTYPNTQLDGLSLLEAQIQLGTSVHFLRFFGNLRFLFYPPSVKELSYLNLGFPESRVWHTNLNVANLYKIGFQKVEWRNMKSWGGGRGDGIKKQGNWALTECVLNWALQRSTFSHQFTSPCLKATPEEVLIPHSFQVAPLCWVAFLNFREC